MTQAIHRALLGLPLAAALLLVGCLGSGGPRDDGQGAIKRQGVQVIEKARPADPVAEVPLLIQLHVYQVPTPLGTVSRNDRFWKHVDEQALDVATYDLLYRNGVRVGVAPASAWEYVKKIADENPAAVHMDSLMGTSARAVEIPAAKDLPSQDLFYYDSENVLIGRSYDRCENFFNLQFEPVPRRAGHVRVKLTPGVRVQRTRLEYSVLNDEREFSFVRPECLYELNLRADIPPDHFLVVAPSADARATTSIGHNFLLKNGLTERLEQVILIVPRTIRRPHGSP